MVICLYWRNLTNSGENVSIMLIIVKLEIEAQMQRNMKSESSTMGHHLSVLAVVRSWHTE